MDLYIDTADRAAAVPLLQTGAFRGITTNPLILQRAGLGSADVPTVHDWAVSHGAEQVFLQAWGTGAEEMTERGRWLAALSSHVTVKFPATLAGATACARLSADGVPTLLTAAHTTSHAVLAAATGATWVAPYVSKIQPASGSALEVVITMQRALVASGRATRVLAASLRGLDAVEALAASGVTAFTLAPALADQLFTDEHALAADRRFQEAAA